MTFARGDAASEKAGILEIGQISKSFGGIKVLEDVTFSIRSCEIVALIGPNGAGKTTLFNIVSGYVRADQGDVKLDGRSLLGLQPHSVAQVGLGRTFQSVRVFNRLTVFDNLMVASETWGGDIYWRALRRQSRDISPKAATRIEASLEFIGLRDHARQPAENLSYGQKKLLAFAMCLMVDRQILLLDEPLAGVQRDIAGLILSKIRDLREAGQSVVFIEHDFDAVVGLADRIVVLNGGRKIAEGPPAEIQRDPLVVKAYLT